MTAATAIVQRPAASSSRSDRRSCRSSSDGLAASPAAFLDDLDLRRQLTSVAARHGRQRVGPDELEPRGRAERDPLEAVVDRELGDTGRQLEIADPPAEPQIEDAEAIAGPDRREAATCRDREVRDGRQAQLRVRCAVGDRRDRQPELADLVSRTRCTLLRQHEQATVEHDLGVDGSGAGLAERLAPRLADAPPKPELAALPQQPAAIRERQDHVAAGTGDLGPHGIDPYDDRFCGVPDRE